MQPEPLIAELAGHWRNYAERRQYLRGAVALQAFAAGAAKIGGGALAGSAAVLAPLAAAVKQFADAGSALNDMMQKLISMNQAMQQNMLERAPRPTKLS